MLINWIMQHINWKKFDRLFGIVGSTSDCHPRGPGFDSRLYSRNFSGSIGSGTRSTQPCEDNWVATWLRSSEIQLVRKLKLRLKDKHFANHKVPVLPSGSNHFSRSWLFGVVTPWNQLENLQLPSKETALNFHYWDVSTCKPSTEALDHNL